MRGGVSRVKLIGPDPRGAYWLRVEYRAGYSRSFDLGRPGSLIGYGTKGEREIE